MPQSKPVVPRGGASDADVRGLQGSSLQITEVKVTEKVYSRTPAQELINPPSFPRLREVSKAG